MIMDQHTCESVRPIANIRTAIPKIFAISDKCFGHVSRNIALDRTGETSSVHPASPFPARMIGLLPKPPARLVGYAEELSNSAGT